MYVVAKERTEDEDYVLLGEREDHWEGRRGRSPRAQERHKKGETIMMMTPKKGKNERKKSWPQNNCPPQLLHPMQTDGRSAKTAHA